jgi:UDP-2-acetamido-3-amino-2,3-dideoxy-glucuronate N-acetyltransferase
MKPRIHRLAQVHPKARIGAGTTVWQYTIVQEGARIGRDCNIGAGCFIENGASIGDHVTVKNDVAVWEGLIIEDGVMIGPNVVLTNDPYPRSPRLPEARPRYRDRKDVILETRIRYGATLGASAAVLAGVTIGRFATVGFASAVTRSVPDYALVVGNPARMIGWVCECGIPLPKGARPACRSCRRRYLAKAGRLARHG